MKTKCNSCGKKEVELMSKAEVKMLSGIIDTTIVNKIIDTFNDWTEQKYFICKACGYREKA